MLNCAHSACHRCGHAIIRTACHESATSPRCTIPAACACFPGSCAAARGLQFKVDGVRLLTALLLLLLVWTPLEARERPQTLQYEAANSSTQTVYQETVSQLCTGKHRAPQAANPAQPTWPLVDDLDSRGLGPTCNQMCLPQHHNNITAAPSQANSSQTHLAPRSSLARPSPTPAGSAPLASAAPQTGRHRWHLRAGQRSGLLQPTSGLLVRSRARPSRRQNWRLQAQRHNRLHLQAATRPRCMPEPSTTHVPASMHAAACVKLSRRRPPYWQPGRRPSPMDRETS